MEWLHSGCKGLVLDDEDDDFIAHFLMDTPQTLFLPGIPLTGSFRQFNNHRLTNHRLK